MTRGGLGGQKNPTVDPPGVKMNVVVLLGWDFE